MRDLNTQRRGFGRSIAAIAAGSLLPLSGAQAAGKLADPAEGCRLQ